jgi:hypothetical protein
LARSNPGGVTKVLGEMIPTFDMFYDYEGTLKELLKTLFALGMKQQVLTYCDALRNVEGMFELFGSLRAQ